MAKGLQQQLLQSLERDKKNLSSVFELFSKPVIDALKERGFIEPTDPQTMLFPVIKSGKNALLMAPTGTGKTEAAFLPILDIMIRENMKAVKGVKLLYITPLRALNRDMLERMQWWCKRFDLRLAVRHGDTSQAERTSMSIVPPDIMITTPETLQIMLVGKRIRNNLKTVRWVIVDEVHELAEDKRGTQLTVGIERLRQITDKEPQIIGLSATVGSPERIAKFLVGSGRDCTIVSVPVEKDIEVDVVMPEPNEYDYELAEKLYTFQEVAARLRFVRELVEKHRSVLIFTNTRSEAEALANRFRVWDPDFPVGIHHSSLSRATREAVERGLKDGKIYGVICTSSLELGIDVGFLKYVIQYNSPRQVTRLLQRIGRSGHRIGEASRGTIITQDSDDMLEAAVLCRKAREGTLEPLYPYACPADVAIHQLAGLLIERQSWTIDELLEFMRRSYPFSELKEDFLRELIQYMVERYPRLASFSEVDRTLKRPRDIRPLFEYYFENVSMIPDEKQYLVVEDEKPVGVLDEAFVSEYGEVGVKFVEGGRCWKIEQIYGDRVYVKAEEDPTGAVPNWVGDEIPVPFEVAQEVGMLRRVYCESLISHNEDEFLKVASNYPVSREELYRAMSEVKEQISLGMPVASDKVMTVEKWDRYAIILAAFGHKVNRLLARVIGYLVSERTGQSVAVHQDPYRIVIESDVSPATIVEIIHSLSNSNLRELAEKAVTRSGIFKRRMIHAAKKCGAISRDADYASVSLSGLIEALRGTPVYKEALNVIFHEDFDVARAEDVIRMISEGEIEIKIIEHTQLSPLARIGMEEISRRGEIVSPERLRAIIRLSANARLESTFLVVACTKCWSYVELKKVVELETIKYCERCGSTYLGITPESYETVFSISLKARSGSELHGKNEKIYKNLIKTAEMRVKNGHIVDLVVAGKGLRISDVERVVERIKKGEDVIDAIMEAERESLRRRYFFSET
jgi:ATP-dependent Lhr-like helicase